ncbi:MAG: hypothetical protein AAGF93_23345 [Cyanobacteria bacterium P01_H01_bin.105]
MKTSISLAVEQPCPYPPLNGDGCTFDWASDLSPLLRIYLANLIQTEIEDFKHTLEFAISEKENIIFFLVKTASLDWSACPYSVHLLGNKAPVVNIKSQESRLSITCLLIESRSNVIKAMKLATISPALTNTLIAMVEQQKRIHEDKKLYHQKVDQLCNQPNLETVLIEKCVGACRAGD